MKSWRVRIAVGCCLVTLSVLLTALAPSPQAADKQKLAEGKSPLSKFMRAKLNASELILEGLALENFALIQKGAKELEKISSAEEWRISNDVMYRQHSNEFQRVVSRLVKAAEEERLDGAALSWVEATMSCIECHRFVRAVLMADKTTQLDLPFSRALPIARVAAENPSK